MKLASKVVHTEDGATFTFKPLTLDDWGILNRVRDQGADPTTKFDPVIEKLLDVQGLQFDDGTPITIEDIRSRTVVPAYFYNRLISIWAAAIVARRKELEAEEGKDTTTDSSDSSKSA